MKLSRGFFFFTKLCFSFFLSITYYGLVLLSALHVLSNRILTFIFLFYKFIYFIYLFLAALGLHCCVRAFYSCGEWGYSSLRCVGFSLRWLLLLRSTGSRHAGFSSCGVQAQQLWLTGSRGQAQQLWRTGLVAPQHVGSSQTRDRTHVPCNGRWILNHCATREAPYIHLETQGG